MLEVASSVLIICETENKCSQPVSQKQCILLPPPSFVARCKQDFRHLFLACNRRQMRLRF